MSSLPVHPILFAVFPALSIFGTNSDELLVADVLPALLTCAATGILVHGVCFLAIREPATAATAATLTLVWFWFFNVVLQGAQDIAGPLGSAAWVALFAAWTTVCAGLGRWGIRQRSARGTTIFLNATGAFLIAGALVPLATQAIQSEAGPNLPASLSENASVQHQIERTDPAHPDVFVIVLDAYGRRDLLEEHFDYRDELATGLERRGFYVAGESESNYNSTHYSLASLLNFHYLDGRPPLTTAKAKTCDSAVRQELSTRGYRFSLCSRAVLSRACRAADHVIRAKNRRLWAALSDYERLLVNATPPEYWLRKSHKRSPYVKHRERILTCLEALPDFSDNGDRDLVFAHVLSPHEPFVFGRRGEDVSPYHLPFKLNRIYRDPDLPEEPGQVGPEYARRYREQAGYIADRVLAAVDEILARADLPPIILVQGDHGPYGFSPRLRPPEYEILNAYYLPREDARTMLYPRISPVNSFRVILNAFFGKDLELLPDERRPHDPAP